jgi:cyclase
MSVEIGCNFTKLHSAEALKGTHMSQRSTLSVGLLMCVAAIAACGSASGSPLLMSQQIAPDFRLEQVAPNVYAFVSNDTTHLVEAGNTTVILTQKGVVVVDAPSTYLSERHLAEIRKLTNKPVIYLINTHFHGDHVFGNHVYASAFPDMHIIAQDNTKADSDKTNPGTIDQMYHGKSGAAVLAYVRKPAEEGIGTDGKPLQGDNVQRAKRDYAEFLPMWTAAQRTVYVSPDITFSDSMTLDFGDTTIKLTHFVGHTKGDAVVYLPKQNILITGDLDIAPVPYGFDDETDSWIKSLETLMAMHAKTIIPGHGEVQFDNSYLQLEHDLLQSLMKQARQAVASGATVDEFKKTVDLSDFEKKLVGDDSDSKWAWDNYFYGPAVPHAYEIAKAAP